MKKDFCDICEICTAPQTEPGFDIGICSECGWRGLLTNCDTEQDGDWEHGYFESPLCPVCKDGGCIDDFDYSPKQLIRYNQYRKAREK
jgi:hypothetical protein